MIRGVANCLVFAAVLTLACMVERALFARVPGHVLEEPGPSVKFERLREGEDTIGLVFVGSSRVFRQLNPKVFDTQLAERGRDVTSFNLGLPGMRFYEQLHLLDQFVARRPAALRWLVIELPDPDPPLENANLLSRRNIEWHTPRVTWFALRTIWGSQRSAFEKLESTWAHVQGLCLRASNMGLGVPSAENVLGTPEPIDDPSKAGFLPLEFDGSAATQRHREEFLTLLAANPRALRDRVDEILDPTKAPRASAALEAELRGLVARLRAAGIEPLFFLSPPSERNNSDWRALRERGALPNLFAYDDPREYPDFYLDRSIRFDMNHVDKTGGNTLTRMLAADVATYMESAASRARAQ